MLLKTYIHENKTRKIDAWLEKNLKDAQYSWSYPVAIADNGILIPLIFHDQAAFVQFQLTHL